MLLVRRHLRPGETDHELVWLLVGLAGIALIWVSWPALVGGGTLCPFKAMTGWPCVSCGATRALVALAEGAIGAALRWNPLATMAMLAWGVWGLYASVALLLRSRRWRVAFDDRDLLRARWVVAAGVAAVWVFLIVDRR